MIRLDLMSRRPTATLTAIALLLGVVAMLADSWMLVASLPQPKWEPAAATGGDGLVYAIGGMDDSGPPSTAAAYAYDPGSDSWSQSLHWRLALAGTLRLLRTTTEGSTPLPAIHRNFLWRPSSDMIQLSPRG